jgi:hypothetical protein
MPTVVQAPPGLNHGHRTLDFADRQLLQGYPDDMFAYHARLLLVPLGGTRWVIATPTLDVYQEDFLDEDIVPLSRNGLFPEAYRPIFAFDHLNEDVMGGLRARAAAIAEVLGVVAPAPVAGAAGDAQWIFSDTASDLFNTLVPVDRLGGIGCKTTASKGIIAWTEDGVEVVEFMERIRERDRGSWLSEKRMGAGRDQRLSALQADDGVDTPLFRVATSDMPRAASAHPLSQGPPAAPNVAKSITASGFEPQGFQTNWVASSGVSARSGVCLEHGLILTVLHMICCIDRLNVFQLASSEYLCRRLLQIQRAVRRSPRSPDFEGLEAFTSHSLDPSGGVLAVGFDRHVASVQKDEAFILKQQRMAREERDTDKDRRPPAAPTKKGKGKDGKGEEA